MTDKPFNATNVRVDTVEEINLMNDRYSEARDSFFAVETPEDERSLIENIQNELLDATEEEIALLVFFHEQGDKDVWVDDVRNVGDFYGSPILKGNGQENAVVKDEDVEDAFAKYMESYIDDVVLPEIPEKYRDYFDTEKFIQDAEGDGMGIMSSYDGDDNEVSVGSALWHIFRMN